MAVASVVEQGWKSPDPNALAVASKLQERLPDAQVVLFGSRGRRGTWERHSDLDLAVIGVDKADRKSVTEVESMSREIARSVYEGQPSPYVQIFPFKDGEYEELRTSRPHIAGQVQFWGLTPEGEPLPAMTQDNPWPSVRKNLRSSCNQCALALKAWGSGNLTGTLVHTQGALELMLKAALDALDVHYDYIHDLPDLSGKLRTARPEWHHVYRVLTWTQQASLTKFRQEHAYVDPEEIPWPDDPAEDLVEGMQDFCGLVAPLVLDEVQRTPDEVDYLDKRGNTAFGGWENVPLDAFSNEAEIVAAEERGRKAGVAQGNVEGQERGINIGMDAGYVQGRAEGRSIGREEGRIEGVEAGREEGESLAVLNLLPALLGSVLSAEDLASPV